MSAWELVQSLEHGTYGRRRTVYHRRTLRQYVGRFSPGQWLSVSAEGDAWRWKRHIGTGSAGVKATGLEPTWRAARAAADEEARATWYAQGCPVVLK